MMRKCKVCKTPIPTFAASKVQYEKKGFCSADHGTAYAMDALRASQERTQATERKKAREARAAERKAYNERKRALRENDLGHQKKLTQNVLNKMIRLLDAGKDCPTCGKMLIDGQYDAGHVRTVAASPETRFDPRAIFGQCRSCNGSGTIRKRTRKTQESVSNLYKQWILENKGQGYHDWLFGYHEPKHYTCNDMREMRAVFAAECRRLEAGNGPSKDWRSL